VTAPNDPLFPGQWNLSLIQIPEAWAVSTGDGATVAVLDTGVAFEDYNDGRYSYRKPPGFSRTKFAPGYDFVDNDDHPNDNLSQIPGRPAHGTHAAAVIAETTNEGEGTASIAPGATIMPIRVLDWEGDGDVRHIAAGIRFAADHGAQVLVMSLAGIDTGAVADAVKYAASKGVTMIAPSGNQGVAQVGYPATDPSVIGVGAVTADKTRAYYSNYGEGLDLVAPGGDVSTDLTGDGQPDGIRQQTLLETLDGFCYCQKEGTSSSAPHVAAVAALLVASGLATTPDQVRHALLSSALDLGPSGPDILFGAGLVQASGALTAATAAAADLSVTTVDSTGEAPTSPAVTSTITVSNAGPAAGTGVILNDTLSPGALATSASASQGGCSPSGGTVTCDLGTLPAGATATVTIVAMAGAEGRVIHDLAVRGAEGDGNRRNNRVGPSADGASRAGPGATSDSDGAGGSETDPTSTSSRTGPAVAVMVVCTGVMVLGAGLVRGRKGRRRERTEPT
jgi:serine protease